MDQKNASQYSSPVVSVPNSSLAFAPKQYSLSGQQPISAPQLFPTPMVTAPTPIVSTPPSATEPSSNQLSNVQLSDEALDAEWVSKAKAIVQQTENDPYAESAALNQIRTEYLHKRYNKDLKQP